MMSEKRKVDFTETVIYNEDAPTLPPPRLEVGAVAWLRQNLFGSIGDTVLTIVSLLVLVTLIVGFFDWAIRSANWYAVINNQRLFMLDRFEAQFEWRVALTVLIAALLTGVSMAVWARRSMRGLTMFAVGIIAVVVLLPLLIKATIPMPPSYFTAGNVEVIDRASTLSPQPALAFIAQAGETVDVRIETAQVNDDEALKQLSGFSDRTTNALANAAQNRLDLQETTSETFERMVSRELTEDLEERNRIEIETFVRTNDMAASTLEFAAMIRDRVALAVSSDALASSDDAPLSLTQLKVWLTRLTSAVNTLEEPDEAVINAIRAINITPANLSPEQIQEESLEQVEALTLALMESPNLAEIGEILVIDLTEDLIGTEGQPDANETLIRPTPLEAEFLHDMFVSLLIPQSVTETYDISEISMQVQILDGNTLTPLAEGVVTPAGEVVTAQIPADGWYVLTKVPVEGETGTAVLAVNGVYPIVERVLGANTSVFVRLTDNELSITDPRPQIEGSDVPFVVLIDNQYRGLRDIQTYLIHFIPLFFEQVARLFVPFMLTVAWGFVIGRAIAHLRGEETHFSNTPSRLLVIGISLVPLVIILLYFALIDGSFGIQPVGDMVGAFLKVALVIFAVFLAGQIDSWLNRMNSGEDAEANITSTLIYAWGIFPILMYVLASGIGNFSGATLGSMIGGIIWLIVMYFIGLNFSGLSGYGLLIAGFFMPLAQSFVIDTVWDTWTDAPVNAIFIWLGLAVVGTAFGVFGHSLRDRIDHSIKRLGFLLASLVFLARFAGIDLMANPDISPLLLGLIGFALLLWVGWMFFNGAHHWTSNRLIIGLVLITYIWMQVWTSVDFWSVLYFLVWLGIGSVAFKRGEEAQRNRRKAIHDSERPLTQRYTLPGLAITAFLWLVALVAIPSLITSLDSAGVLQTSPNDLLPLSDKRAWGGLMLTMQLTILGIGASFPIGLLLALGRRSNLPVVKTACIIYIETVRGVPLITVLFLATLLVPLIDPTLATIEGAVRVWVGVTMFSAAYLAENVRGGLQSIPTGQTEAAQAIGLSGWQTTLYILLPQALRAVIPALVGQFISLFKDTSLVVIVGLAEITGIANRVVAQPEFLQKRQETYLYIAIIYFVFSYIMSYISRRVEETGSGAARARQI